MMSPHLTPNNALLNNIKQNNLSQNRGYDSNEELKDSINEQEL